MESTISSYLFDHTLRHDFTPILRSCFLSKSPYFLPTVNKLLVISLWCPLQQREKRSPWEGEHKVLCIRAIPLLSFSLFFSPSPLSAPRQCRVKLSNLIQQMSAVSHRLQPHFFMLLYKCCCIQSNS